MKELIKTRLQDIASQQKITILYACESGSRGWEFPSPDSDYDVRFIYARKMDEYLSVDEYADNLAFPINDELDLHGWDLRKTLQLIRKSNTTPFEWLQSPIVYQEEPGFRDALLQLCHYYFGQRSNTHHYLGITRGAMETMNTDGTIKIKKLFYVLRPLLSAKWCLDKKRIAPMSIQPLMELLPDDLRETLLELIQLKATAAEGFLIRPEPALISWIKETEADCIQRSHNMGKDQFDAKVLNDFFRQTLRRYDHTGT
ncbi:MAG: nucleotidyltransferase domain-containing protein [Sphingobacteriales bacterium]|nr:MAG: nucleotidyltransferase domain-containing protein [Sphingobacteriales bacterium]